MQKDVEEILEKLPWAQENIRRGSDGRKVPAKYHKRQADGRTLPSFLTQAPILNRNPEMRKLARAKEEHYIRKVAEEFNRFLSFYGSLEGFSVSPKGMDQYEIKMAQAARAGDYNLVQRVGEAYLTRAQAYVDLWRDRAWKRAESDDRLREKLKSSLPPRPPRPDGLTVKSSRIPKDAPSGDSGGGLLFE